MPSTVQAVSILTLVHGVLLALFGVLMVVTAPIMLATGEEIPVVILGALLGVAWALAGGAQVVCGVQVQRRRWRIPTLVVNLAALVVTMPMCCALSMGLGVLSTVLLSQPDVARWFAEAEV